MKGEEKTWGIVSKELQDGDNSKDQKTIETVDNHIYFYTDVTRKDICNLNKELRITGGSLWREAQMQEREPASIFLHINSYGGVIFHGFAGMDAIRTAKVPVVTIIDGCCASAGTFLSLVGTKRLIHKNACMLIHQLSSFAWGNFEQLKDDMKNCEMLMRMIKSVYKEYTKVPMSKLDEILKHDLWFDADTCLKYGMVDEII